MSWGMFAGALALALFIIAYLYFKVRQNEAAQAALAAEEEARKLVEKQFAEAQAKERAQDVAEGIEVVESGDRAGAIDFLRDSLRKN